MTAVQISNLKKVYKNGTQALKGVSFEIAKGDFFALLGENGAGKTTIIGILTGLITKSDGIVKVFDHDLDTELNDVKRSIGVVPQEFNFDIFEKIEDVILNQAGYYGLPLEIARPRTEELLKKLDLWEKRDKQGMTLSGGMKRRLMIARALVHQPKLLILDEPTAGVDVSLRHGMWEYLKELNKNGTTILLTTHYLEEVEQLCKNAAIIQKGEIIKNDSVQNLLHSLEEETFLIDTLENTLVIKNANPKKLNYSIVDDKTLEIKINKEDKLIEIFQELEKIGLTVTAIRPKGNRLEELFLNLTNN